MSGMRGAPPEWGTLLNSGKINGRPRAHEKIKKFKNTIEKIFYLRYHILVDYTIMEFFML